MGQDPGNTTLKCSQKEKTKQESTRLREKSGCLESEKKSGRMAERVLRRMKSSIANTDRVHSQRVLKFVYWM